MRLIGTLRSAVCRRPVTVVALWMALAVAVGVAAPDLSRLAAEGQSRLLAPEIESRRASEVIAEAWPDQAFQSLAVAAVFRPEGLTPADRAFAADLAARFEAEVRPRAILRVLGPASEPEVAARLISRDGTVALVGVPLATPFVTPLTQNAVSWLRARAADAPAPEGLRVLWTGDAVIGRDYMANVQTSLDRAAVATVVLLLVVLLAVYRSVLLSLVPLATIGLSLLLSRGLLGWMAAAGWWEISPLVELFLVAVLFGSGTDFCLFLSWRFAENWDPDDPVSAMERTQKCSSLALLTSAGTVIMGLSLMGTTKFKMFSSTGPSVAIGLALTLVATLTLTPALLVLLAKWRPQAFHGLTRPASDRWERIGAWAMARPARSWALSLLVMAPLAVVAFRTNVVQDLLTEMPGKTPSSRAYKLLSSKFEPGSLAPLTVVLESDSDLRTSEGLALIDDVSRFLDRQRGLTEVRSATQPLGSAELLKPARIGSRFGQIHDGLGQMADGASKLRQGLYEGLAKLRAALWLEQKTGLSVGLPKPSEPATAGRPTATASRSALGAGFRRASSALLGTPAPASTPRRAPAGSADKGDDPREQMARELATAAEGAAKIAEGAALARREVGAVLEDPVGRDALDRLLIDRRTVREHPELNRSFGTYITSDGRRARIDLTQSYRVFSAEGMDQVMTLRRKLRDFLDSARGPRVTALIAGANSDSADVRALTFADQMQSWWVIPSGVFLVLILSLRDPLACFNLVATMLLTYLFALGATHLVFVTGLGAEGLDWKVPYFLFVLLVAVGVDYNVFLMARLHEETCTLGLRRGIVRAIGQTGGLITSAAAITACSFASFLSSPLMSLRQLGFALVVGITVDALLVRPLLVPCGHWLLTRLKARWNGNTPAPHAGTPARAPQSSQPARPPLPRMVGAAEGA